MSKYWYFLLPAILCAIIPSDWIDKTTKKLIPDDKKRAKVFFGILIGMAVFFTVWLFLITQNIPQPVRFLLSLFPLASVGLGLLIGKMLNKFK